MHKITTRLLTAAFAATLLLPVGCAVGPDGEETTEAPAPGLAANAGEGEEIHTQAIPFGYVGHAHVCWPVAGLYYYNNSGCGVSVWKDLHNGHLVHVSGTTCSEWAQVQDNYNNTGVIRRDALCAGW